jgi:hypothetical protein
MFGRAMVAKTLEVTGLVLVGMALLIGLRDDDMNRELMTLGLGAVVFLAGWLLEPRG